MCGRLGYLTAALQAVTLLLCVSCVMVSVSTVHNKLSHFLPHRLRHAVVREGKGVREVCPLSVWSSKHSSPYEYRVECISSMCAHCMRKEFFRNKRAFFINCHTSKFLICMSWGTFNALSDDCFIIWRGVGDSNPCTSSLCHGRRAHKRKLACT